MASGLYLLERNGRRPEPYKLSNRFGLRTQVFGQNKCKSWNLPKALRNARPSKALLILCVLILLHLCYNIVSIQCPRIHLGFVVTLVPIATNHRHPPPPSVLLVVSLHYIFPHPNKQLRHARTSIQAFPSFTETLISSRAYVPRFGSADFAPASTCASRHIRSQKARERRRTLPIHPTRSSHNGTDIPIFRRHPVCGNIVHLLTAPCSAITTAAAHPSLRHPLCLPIHSATCMLLSYRYRDSHWW